jgi:hypothetical protein
MKTRLAIGALVLGALSMPALAGTGPFEAEIDCGGNVSPPVAVPFTLRFESQAQQAQAIDVTVRLTLPTGQMITLRDTTINLRANQDRTINQSLNLKDTSPRGNYQMTLVATSNHGSTFDTCSFSAS